MRERGVQSRRVRPGPVEPAQRTGGPPPSRANVWQVIAIIAIIAATAGWTTVAVLALVAMLLGQGRSGRSERRGAHEEEDMFHAVPYAVWRLNPV